MSPVWKVELEIRGLAGGDTCGVSSPRFMESWTPANVGLGHSSSTTSIRNQVRCQALRRVRPTPGSGGGAVLFFARGVGKRYFRTFRVRPMFPGSPLPGQTYIAKRGFGATKGGRLLRKICGTSTPKVLPPASVSTTPTSSSRLAVVPAVKSTALVPVSTKSTTVNVCGYKATVNSEVAARGFELSNQATVLRRNLTPHDAEVLKFASQGAKPAAPVSDPRLDRAYGYVIFKDKYKQWLEPESAAKAPAPEPLPVKVVPCPPADFGADYLPKAVKAGVAMKLVEAWTGVEVAPGLDLGIATAVVVYGQGLVQDLEQWVAEGHQNLRLEMESQQFNQTAATVERQALANLKMAEQALLNDDVPLSEELQAKVDAQLQEVQELRKRARACQVAKTL